MDRNAFLRTCGIGACSCAAVLFSGLGRMAGAQEETKKKEIDQKQQFVNSWTSHLMLVMDENLDTETKERIMEACGRGCAERGFSEQINKYKGNVEGLLEQFKKNWAESLEYDKDRGFIKMVGKKQESCPCPMVRGLSKMESKTFCMCSKGWIKQVFGTIIGKPVDVSLGETILRGGDRCIFNIAVKTA